MVVTLKIARLAGLVAFYAISAGLVAGDLLLLAVVLCDSIEAQSGVVVATRRCVLG